MTHETNLRIILRAIGSVSLFATVFVAVPYSWMDAIHQWLGMGNLPDAPIVGYLARSTSAFYAIFGGLLWVVSFEILRYRPIIHYIGGVTLVLGIALLVIDWTAGLPLFWRIAEGPFVIVLGAVLLYFSRSGQHGDVHGA